MTTSDQNTPASKARVDEAVSRLTAHARDHRKTVWYREDIAAVVAEIARLRRNSEALGLLVAEMAPRPEIAVGPPGLEQFAAVLETVIQCIATDPRELDLIADAIIESRRGKGPGPSVEH